jgi:hypothetical protein
MQPLYYRISYLGIGKFNPCDFVFEKLDEFLEHRDLIQ